MTYKILYGLKSTKHRKRETHSPTTLRTPDRMSSCGSKRLNSPGQVTLTK